MKKTIDYYLSLPYRLEIVPDIEVTPNVTPESSTERNAKGDFVDYLALQVHVHRTT